MGGDGGRGSNVVFVVDRVYVPNGLPLQSSFKAQSGEKGMMSARTVPRRLDCSSASKVQLFVMQDWKSSLTWARPEFYRCSRWSRWSLKYPFYDTKNPAEISEWEPGRGAGRTKFLLMLVLVEFPSVGKINSAQRNYLQNLKFSLYSVLILRAWSVLNQVSPLLADLLVWSEGASQGVSLGTQFLRHIERRYPSHHPDMSMMKGLIHTKDYLAINKGGITPQPSSMGVPKSLLLIGWICRRVRRNLEGSEKLAIIMMVKNCMSSQSQVWPKQGLALLDATAELLDKTRIPSLWWVRNGRRSLLWLWWREKNHLEISHWRWCNGYFQVKNSWNSLTWLTLTVMSLLWEFARQLRGMGVDSLRARGARMEIWFRISKFEFEFVD